MLHYGKVFFMTALVFLIIDGIWLAFIGGPLYQKELGPLLKSVNVLPAAFFYLLYVIGMMVFIINPAIHSYEFKKVMVMGFLFGAVCYATYDLTNMATLNGWSWKVTLLDIVWGGTVTMITTTLVSYWFRGV